MSVRMEALDKDHPEAIYIRTGDHFILQYGSVPLAYMFYLGGQPVVTKGLHACRGAGVVLKNWYNYLRKERNIARLESAQKMSTDWVVSAVAVMLSHGYLEPGKWANMVNECPPGLFGHQEKERLSNYWLEKLHESASDIIRNMDRVRALVKKTEEKEKESEQNNKTV